mmetsp:Transcript_16709/g.47808  ORF Transcript_16709/g.47808 Transcript_16709/m.47808 type:complete len:208 (-) Transcript_16709:241-864(-)
MGGWNATVVTGATPTVAPRNAFACFLRRFFSPGSHRWQKRQSTPLRQPPLPTKAQGLQRPRLWPMDPMLGAKAGAAAAAPVGAPGRERPGGGPVTAAATALRRASPASGAAAAHSGVAGAVATTGVSMPAVTPAGVAAGVGAGVDSNDEPAEVAEPPGWAASTSSSESSVVEHSDSASTSSSTVGRLPFGVTVHRPMPWTARHRRRS